MGQREPWTGESQLLKGSPKHQNEGGLSSRPASNEESPEPRRRNSIMYKITPKPDNSTPPRPSARPWLRFLELVIAGGGLTVAVAEALHRW